MMPSDNIPAKPVASSDDNQTSGSRKTAPPRPPEQPPKCPRCDSSNTKFCYYNNYSLTQPRHFCKTCRRYWTKGGALRNVPIGGGCRKNKKNKSGSRINSGDANDAAGASSETTGLKIFHGISSPAMDYHHHHHLGGIPFSCLQHSSATTGLYNQFVSTTNPSSFDVDTVGSAGSLMGFTNYPVSSVLQRQGGGDQEMVVGSMNVHSSLASSIESLSYINQDLHWKLQQQRLGMLFGGENQNQKESGNSSSVSANLLENQIEKPQTILFQNLEISKPEVHQAVHNNPRTSSGNNTTEWFFENCYTPTATTTTTTNSSSNGNDNTSNNWNNGVPVWSDLQHYSGLP